MSHVYITQRFILAMYIKILYTGVEFIQRLWSVCPQPGVKKDMQP